MTGKLLKAEQRTFKPSGGETEYKFWWIEVSDPEENEPFGIKFHKELGDRLFSNEATLKQYLAKNCVYTLQTSYYNKVRKYQVIDIQEA